MPSDSKRRPSYVARRPGERLYKVGGRSRLRAVVYAAKAARKARREVEATSHEPLGEIWRASVLKEVGRCDELKGVMTSQQKAQALVQARV